MWQVTDSVLVWKQHLLLRIIITGVILILEKCTLQFILPFLINPVMNPFPFGQSSCWSVEEQ